MVGVSWLNIGELFAASLTPTPVLPAAQGGGAGRNLVDIPVTRQKAAVSQACLTVSHLKGMKETRRGEGAHRAKGRKQAGHSPRGAVCT